MAVDNPKSHLVVFDTREYAGNFERAMCAFITGQASALGVGSSEAAVARPCLVNLAWYDKNIVPVRDRATGYLHIVTIWPTIGRFGFGEHYDDTPEVRATLTGQAAVSTNPVYESAAIYVRKLPPADVLAEMVERAKQYCAMHHLTYAGHRLLEVQYEARPGKHVAGYLDVTNK